MKSKIIFFLCLFTLGVAGLQAQNTWKTLSKVTFKMEFSKQLGLQVQVPKFSEEVKALNGKTITIKGYIIPEAGYKNHRSFIFSALPYNLCYFCGGAGPETVMQVATKEPVKFTQNIITLEGKLTLNAFDPNQLIYILSDAKIIK